MIGSFWNLCRACPSMPVDKLHSEYRSTYRWHEFTGNSRPEVVRRAPVPNPNNQFVGQTNEPSLPRRKKCPELAYKSHEFIIGSEYADARNNVAANRIPRSEERGGTPSRRSKSEGPPAVPNGRAYPIPAEVDGVATKQAGESNGLFKKTFTKLSTEYRLQFVWPNVRKSIKGPKPNDAAGDALDQPKKSQSMGALKAQQQLLQQQQQLQPQQQQQQQQTMMPTVHKKRTTSQKEATLHELEPLVSDAEDRKPQEKQLITLGKKSAPAARPFSHAFEQERNSHYVTKKENFGFDEQRAAYEMDNKRTALLNGSAPPHSQPNLELWFKEVAEQRKKAGEYKSRGWGIEIDPELYKKQRALWDQVSKRSSLSALSLASSIHRPITKEEKEEENNKKSLPLKATTPPPPPPPAPAPASVPAPDRPVSVAATTTAAPALAPAPTKPSVPGQAHLISDNRVDEMTALPIRFSNIRHHLERTTGPDVEEGALLPSPTREKLMPAITKRESESQRGSPKKTAASRHGSPQKGSPQKGSPKKTLKSRSQSVGPGYVENESPRRRLRSASTAPGARLGAAGKRTPTAAAATATATAATTPGSAHHSERKARPYDAEDGRDTGVSVSSCSPPPGPEIIDGPIVKSPPEPTRVKSPEQIIMRSPDPVNWTVPLDTGKTFTVTQNVKEGETYSRPQSEIKASTPVEKPPPPPQSAPPELTEQVKMDVWKNADRSDRKSSPTVRSPTSEGSKINAGQGQGQSQRMPFDARPVPGSTLRCLDDPGLIFDADATLATAAAAVAGGSPSSASASTTTTTTTASTARSAAADVLERARDRFDRFWGGSKEESV